MARKGQSPPPPPPPEEPEKRKLLSRMDRIFLIVCLLIFLYVGFRQCGFDMVSKTEKIEMTDDPHQ